MILGSTGSYGAGNRDVWFIKTDPDGNEIWTKTYGTNGYQDAFSFTQTSEGGYIIAGHSDIHGAELLDAYLIKTDPDGNLIWDELYEGSDDFYDYAKDILLTPEGYYLVCGHTKIRNTRKNQAFLFLVDNTGAMLWSEEYGGQQSEWAASICRAGDGGYVFTGHTGSEGSGNLDVWLSKIQHPLTSIEEGYYTGQSVLFRNIPNPFTTATMIRFFVGKEQTASVRILDCQGSVIRNFPPFSGGQHHLKWDRADSSGVKVKCGIYFLIFESGTQRLVNKMIVID